MRSLPLCLLSLGLLSAQVDFNALKPLKYRQIGPFRGGRAVAVAGITTQPATYYFGATGGGIWKTTDCGATWLPVSDGQLHSGSVGALAVSESDPNVIYAGMGEACVRGNAANGDGVYKSVDSGKTWNNIGLADTLPHRRSVRASRAIPISSTSPPSATSWDPTTSAASTAPRMAATPGSRSLPRTAIPARWILPWTRPIPACIYAALLAGPPQALDLR